MGGQFNWDRVKEGIRRIEAEEKLDASAVPCICIDCKHKVKRTPKEWNNGVWHGMCSECLNGFLVPIDVDYKKW